MGKAGGKTISMNDEISPLYLVSIGHKKQKRPEASER